MEKIYFQGTFGAYSHLAALSVAPKAKIIPCKTFDECFLKASEDPSSKIIIPESNRITGNIGIEYLVFKYRLNIYSEYFQKIEHNLLGVPGAKISDLKDVYSHGQALSQCSNFIKSHNLTEHVRADTAGSAEMISINKDKTKAAIASSLSAKTYNLDIKARNTINSNKTLNSKLLYLLQSNFHSSLVYKQPLIFIRILYLSRRLSYFLRSLYSKFRKLTLGNKNFLNLPFKI